MVGEGKMLRSMIAERTLDTPPTVGKCVELSRCVVSDSGVSNLRCVVLPHLVHPLNDVVDAPAIIDENFRLTMSRAALAGYFHIVICSKFR
jgi:hypothetical protein